MHWWNLIGLNELLLLAVLAGVILVAIRHFGSKENTTH
jgi:hypothetical protein